MLPGMELAAYLDRIGLDGVPAADLAGLRRLHRAHLNHIPYENLDVQLGRPVDLDIERTYHKIIGRRRGGWCYEMNGLFGWALSEAGFDVTRMVGGVMASLAGEVAMGSHLVLRVQLEQPYLVDVGLGDGLREPIPILGGNHHQDDREFRLETLDEEGRWRFHNHEGRPPPDFDFRMEAADEARLEALCQTLQTEPTSLFVQNLICIRTVPGHGATHLIGRVLAKADAEKEILTDVDAFLDTLENHFGLRDPEFADLWPKLCARHEEMFGDRPASEINLGGPPGGS